MNKKLFFLLTFIIHSFFSISWTMGREFNSLVLLGMQPEAAIETMKYKDKVRGKERKVFSNYERGCIEEVKSYLNNFNEKVNLNKSDFIISNMQGDTLLHKALCKGDLEFSEWYYRECCVEGRFSPICYDLGVEKYENEKGDTAFHKAVSENSDKKTTIKKIKCLKNLSFFDVNIKNKNGKSLLHSAVCGNKKIIRFLIDKKQSLVHEKDENGNTPLHAAVEKLSLDAIDILLQNGANVNEKNDKGKAPLDFCVDSILPNEKSLFSYNETEPKAFLDFEDIIKFLLKREGLIVDKEVGEYLLLYAIKNGSSDVVKLLLEKGVSPNVIDSGRKHKVFQNIINSSALFYAVFDDNLDIVKCLVEAGADIDYKIKEYETAFTKSLTFRNKEGVIEYLLDQGARIDFEYYQGKPWFFNYVAARCIKKPTWVRGGDFYTEMGYLMCNVVFLPGWKPINQGGEKSVNSLQNLCLKFVAQEFLDFENFDVLKSFIQSDYPQAIKKGCYYKMVSLAKIDQIKILFDKLDKEDQKHKQFAQSIITEIFERHMKCLQKIINFENKDDDSTYGETLESIAKNAKIERFAELFKNIREADSFGSLPEDLKLGVQNAYERRGIKQSDWQES